MEELRNQLIRIINNSGLSFDCIYYIVKDVYREIADEYFIMLKNQAAKDKEQEKKEEKSNG